MKESALYIILSKLLYKWELLAFCPIFLILGYLFPRSGLMPVKLILCFALDKGINYAYSRLIIVLVVGTIIYYIYIPPDSQQL